LSWLVALASDCHGLFGQGFVGFVHAGWAAIFWCPFFFRLTANGGERADAMRFSVFVCALRLVRALRF
jgi:hypothetical protein